MNAQHPGQNAFNSQDNYFIRAGKTVILQHDFLGDPSHAMRSDEDSLRRLVSDSDNDSVSQRHTDEVTLRKLIDEGLLISAQDGYKLSDRYYEIVKKTTVNVTGQKDDTINVQLLDINKLTERQIVIYNSIKEGVQLNVQLNTTDLSKKLSIGFKTMQRELKVIENLGLIVRVGSKKTGHWEVINKG